MTTVPNVCWAFAVWLNTAKDHNGPTKDREGALHRTAKDCKGTLWARLQEIGTNWNQWCFIFQYAPRFFKTRSFTSVFILCLLGSHWSLICIVKICELRNENNYVISIILTTTYGLSTVKLGPTDVHSGVCNQQRLLRALTAYLFLECRSHWLSG